MLVAYTNALDRIRTLRPIVEQLKQRSADIAAAAAAATAALAAAQRTSEAS